MFRKTLFWIHLVTGLLAGVIIALKCATGIVLTLEKPIVAWIDRDVRRVSPVVPEDAPRLSLDDLTRRLREARPDARPASLSVEADPAANVQFRFGRDEIVYVNPYTGAVLPSRAADAQRFFRSVVGWHRWFALDGDARQVGKQVGGAANVIFLLLALTGLYLWWPRHWSWRGFRAIAVFNLRLAGKARDFNWHNSLGLWTAPLLIVITASALPISYRWAGDLIPRLTGDPVEGPRGEGGERRAPAEGMARKTQAPQQQPRLDTLFSLAAQAVPGWENITLRLGGAQGGPGGRRPSTPAALGTSGSNEAGTAGGPSGASRSGGRGGAGGSGGLSAQVREPSTWPRTASITLQFDAAGESIVGRDTFGSQTSARQIRGWTRFLHTGEALGWWGQVLAGIACVGGLFLVYTGIALSWRRFFRRRTA